MNAAGLPSGFDDLQPFLAAGWAGATESARVTRRSQASRAELLGFYDAMRARLADAIVHLDGHPLAALPPAEENLMHLVLSLAEVTFIAEKFGGDERKFEGIEASRFVPVHELRGGGLAPPPDYRASD